MQFSGGKSGIAMDSEFISMMEEFYASLILLEGVKVNKATFALVSSFPDATGQDFLLTLCRVAIILEAEADQSNSILRPLHNDIFKCTAILAIDIIELGRKANVSQNGHSLLVYWSDTDEALFTRSSLDDLDGR